MRTYRRLNLLIRVFYIFAMAVLTYMYGCSTFTFFLNIPYGSQIQCSTQQTHYTHYRWRADNMFVYGTYILIRPYKQDE